ncbi:MAG: TonB-dependent receptor plug domain-containing protein [Bacteroidota bacterium]
MPKIAELPFKMLALNRFFLLLLLVLCSLTMNAQKGNAILYGVVSDSTGKPLPSATVALYGSNQFITITDSLGKYELELPALRQDTVIFSHLGLGFSKAILNLKEGERHKLNKSLYFSSTDLKGVEVVSEKIERGSGMTRIDPKLSNVIPGPGGNSVENLIKTRPGVTSNNELSSQYNVRGGNYDENLVYVNDVEVYRPFLIRSGQQEGLSFINSDMVSNISFSAGGFGACYGDKMSSVLDIKYKRATEFAGSASLSLLGESLSLEGSAGKGHRFSYLLGVRQKSTQYILGSLDTKGDYKPSSTDIQGYIAYDINDKWQLDILGNYSQNKYNVVPSNRTTTLGTVSEAIQFQVYFDGQEVDNYQTMTGAVSLIFHPNDRVKLKFITSAFQTTEDETYDIEGQFYLNQLNNNLGSSSFGQVAFNLGVGTFINHARDYLNANVYNFEHKGFLTLSPNNEFQYGAKVQHEMINDNMNEWNYVDSAGFSIPIQPDTAITLQNTIWNSHNISSNRFSGYVQDEIKWGNGAKKSLSIGVRANYWDLNRQTAISPRANFSIKPDWKKDFVFYIASGVYYQPPFFKEMLDLSGNFHPDVKAQESIHFVAGMDYNFRAWNRPFKFVTEAYYKILNNLDPYFIDDVRIRYFGNNTAKGYAEGIDFRVNGEFVKNVESWASLSIMQTKEIIANNTYYLYYNQYGQLITPSVIDARPVDSVKKTVGYVPRPADQRISFSIFFQDYIPKHPTYKMNLSLVFGTGFPFGPPNSIKFIDYFRMPFYRRVDIGFSKQLVGENAKTPSHITFLKHFNSIWLSLEVFNLLDVSNTVSYIWVQDSGGTKYAIPNYLTTRQLNLRLNIKF